MITEFVRHSGLAIFQLASLIFFVCFYVGALALVLRKQNQNQLQQTALLPLVRELSDDEVIL
jgi:hypothetical protein